jgi:xanthine dehydrogenase YagS FAD-binding subunit
MISFPKTVDEAVTAAVERGGVYRAGGTDLQDRRAHLAVHGQTLAPIVDLRDVSGLDVVACDHQSAWIGSLTTLATIANHPVLRERWPGVSEACAALANPQIRAVASLAGNLMQGPRCWYYRHPDYTCLRKGGTTCFAREGDHLFHVCFDDAPCVTPHPSTAALALLAYEAEVEFLQPGVVEPKRVPIEQILELDGLPEGGLLTAVRLGPPRASERSAYVRASNRAYAEWALVEVSVRLVLGATGEIAFARVTAGAVAPTPLRLHEVEAALLGSKPEPDTLAAAAKLARTHAKPLPMTGYKLDLLEGSVLEALERALERSPTPAALGFTPGEPG